MNAEFEAGRLVPIIDGPYKLEDTANALRRFASAEHLGKIVLPAFFFVIRQRFVVKEELLMEETFGDDYVTYKNDVRRWL